jgi:chromosome segregation ATPase
MIKEKHNGLIKTLQENLTLEVNNRLKDYESQIEEYKLRLDAM